MPQVLNKRHDTIPSEAVYVGRPSEWGNPFKIGRDGNREEVIEKFRLYVEKDYGMVAKIRSRLRGKDLVCWCAPMPCHAHVLLYIANQPPARK